MKSFETVAYGKWILCGEHAVLRNSPALVFPLYSTKLNFQYKEGKNPLELKLEGELAEHYRVLFLSAYYKALDLLGLKPMKGEVRLSGDLPVGSGLGASAAICVAIGKWFHDFGYVKKDNLFSFSKSLEDIFHGESSGVDIAVNLEQKPISFSKDSRGKVSIRPLKLNWKPLWFLSFSGEMGFTAQSVEKVKNLFKTDYKKACDIDRQMTKATQAAEKAICHLTQKEGLFVLKEALDKAFECFQRWGLLSEGLRRHIKDIENKSCLALKPTGSGEGGYVLSLWDTPPTSCPFSMIPV